MAPLEGPIGVGALVDAIMLGCIIVQSCLYYKNARGDTWLLKALVSLFLLLFLSQLGCTAAWLWTSANTPVPNYVSIVFGTSNVFGATILFLERCFFSHRILKASNNHLLAFLLYLFCVISFTAALGAASVFFSNTTDTLTDQLKESWIFPLAFISGLVCDLAISVTVAFYLRLQTPTEEADFLGFFARLPLLIAETSAMTSLFNVTATVVYWLTRSNFAWVGLVVAMPGVFANAVFAALNARGHLCADIEHQRTSQLGDKRIDEQPKKPPILITILKQAEKRPEKNPV